ncbi:homeodomain-like protein [TM7 phage DolZOral124_53_65]|nr:homeodomain-like protein [TM7 phage DolZOral124_53_65]
MVFSERVTHITYSEILPSIVDSVNNSNIFTARVTSNPKNWKGHTMHQTIRVANSTTGGSFDGLDSFDTSATNNGRQLTWYVKGNQQSVVIPGIEKAVNGNSDKQVLSLVSEKLDEAKNSLINSIGDQLYGYGVGKDFDGLGLIVDDGSATASYGGLQRADVPQINGDVTAAAGGNLTLDLVSSEFDAVSAAGSGQEAPTIGLTTKAVWSLFEKVLNGKLSADYSATSIKGYNRVSGKTPVGVSVPAEALKGALGVDAISYRGKPVVADDKAPEGTYFWLNENYLEFRRLLSPDLESVSSKNQVSEGVYKDNPAPSFLQLREFLKPVNQFGEIGALVVLGNLFHRQPRRNGKITGITNI